MKVQIGAAGYATSVMTERAVVQQLLTTAIAPLYRPFDHLARTQIEKAYPLRCATTVLATCVPEYDSPDIDGEQLQKQRLYLAAALQMLQVALSIHRLLLQHAGQPRSDTSLAAEDTDDANQRSITGSIILTGDYCFTQSAILAAKTDNVRVVEIFSQTLKRVSENVLRQLFAQRNNPGAQPPNNASALADNETNYDVELALCNAGIEGAAVLIGCSPTQVAHTKTFVEYWLTTTRRAQTTSKATALLAELPTAQRNRWQEVLQST